MIIYGIERFVFEFFRGDPGRGEVLGGLMSGTQLIALGLVVSGFLIYLRRTPSALVSNLPRRQRREDGSTDSLAGVKQAECEALT